MVIIIYFVIAFLFLLYLCLNWIYGWIPDLYYSDFLNDAILYSMCALLWPFVFATTVFVGIAAAICATCNLIRQNKNENL